MRSDKVNSLKEDKFLAAKAILIGNIIGIIVFFILMILFSFIFLKSSTLPCKFVTPVVLIVGTIGAFFCGYFSVRILREKGLVYGSIAGSILFFIIYLIGVIVFQEPAGINTLLRCIMMILASSIGGIIGVNKTPKKAWK